ncbi:D-2-hydroxyacid dehydrogenase [Marispirochaeta sp.]|uniref:D-2-hydroxyacid dehydrogenase n=1 Tax=Marispirochaeta sp. TaxID=2038653 RepID=UPI0029C91F48|nr:D-2-hydroxyacid dehydrogenase [Marispirochaeta sp.]
MKIVVLDGYTLNPGDLSWKELEALGEVKVYDRTPFDEKTVIERAKGAEIVLTNKTPLSKVVLDSLDGLRYIGVLATGYNVVDTDAAAALGIPVTNIPTYGTFSVAQMAMAHILHFCHHVKEHSDTVMAGDWAAGSDFCYWNFPLVELAGKTMGIIGFGRIGRALGKIADAFGMKVIAHDVYQGNPPDWEGFRFSSVEELLRESDFVSLNCPLTKENTGFINKESLKTMKKSAFLVNVSRGPLVVAEDLAEALKNGDIAGAGLDVLTAEPPEKDNVLYDVPNLTITPHIAWATLDARSRLMNTAVENLKAFLRGNLENVVNEL